jgi:hypothetical protein
MTTDRRTVASGVALAVALLFPTGACESEQSVTLPGADVAGATDAAGAADGAGGGVVGPTLTVALGAEEQTVDLGVLPSAAGDDGVARVVLADALGAAGAGDLAGWACDFVAGEGFRTSSRGEGCEPLSCDLAVSGHVALTTRDLSWVAELGLRGCYQVRDLARVELTAAAE